MRNRDTYDDDGQQLPDSLWRLQLCEEQGDNLPDTRKENAGNNSLLTSLPSGARTVEILQLPDSVGIGEQPTCLPNASRRIPGSSWGCLSYEEEMSLRHGARRPYQDDRIVNIALPDQPPDETNPAPLNIDEAG